VLVEEKVKKKGVLWSIGELYGKMDLSLRGVAQRPQAGESKVSPRVEQARREHCLGSTVDHAGQKLQRGGRGT